MFTTYNWLSVHEYWCCSEFSVTDVISVLSKNIINDKVLIFGTSSLVFCHCFQPGIFFLITDPFLFVRNPWLQRHSWLWNNTLIYALSWCHFPPSLSLSLLCGHFWVKLWQLAEQLNSQDTHSKHTQAMLTVQHTAGVHIRVLADVNTQIVQLGFDWLVCIWTGMLSTDISDVATPQNRTFLPPNLMMKIHFLGASGAHTHCVWCDYSLK